MQAHKTLACLMVAIAMPLSAAELPQQHAYQKSLRQWLASLQVQDFSLELKPFSEPAAKLSDAQNYRYWLLAQHAGTIQVGGLAVAPEKFTLAQIEAADRVYMPPVSGSELAFLS